MVDFKIWVNIQYWVNIEYVCICVCNEERRVSMLLKYYLVLPWLPSSNFLSINFNSSYIGNGAHLQLSVVALLGVAYTYPYLIMYADWEYATQFCSLLLWLGLSNGEGAAVKCPSFCSRCLRDPAVKQKHEEENTKLFKCSKGKILYFFVWWQSHTVVRAGCRKTN